MPAYILRRLLQAIPTLLGVMLLTFVLFRMLPTDFASTATGGGVARETLADIRAAYGLNKPLFFNPQGWRERGLGGLFDAQFFDHMKGLLTFDFGRSWQTHRKVSEMIADGAGPSLQVMLPVYFGLIASSLALGLLAAHRHGSRLDRALTMACVVLLNVPMLLLVELMQYGLAFKLGWFPVYGYDSARNLVLPVLIGILAGLGDHVLLFRTTVLEESRQFYAVAASARGLSRSGVLRRHVLRNALVPIFSRILLALPFLFMGSLLLERFFGIPGLGYLMIDAIQHRDYVVVNAVTFLSTIIYCVWSVVIDVAYAWADPRIVLK